MAEHDLNRLAGYLESRLDVAERAEVVAHLVACAECRATLAAMAREAPALDLPAGAPTGDVRPPQASSAGNHSTRAPRTRRAARWLPLAATLTLAAGAGWIVSGVIYPPVGNTPATPPPTPQAPSATPLPVPPASPSPGKASRDTGPSTSTGPDTSPGTDTRRGGERKIGGKTFTLVAGEWIDAAYDPFALLPVLEIRTVEDRRALLKRLPALTPFAALAPKVIVVHGGTVYRLDLPR